MIRNKVKAARESKRLSLLDLACSTKIAPCNTSAVDVGKEFLSPGYLKRTAIALEIFEDKPITISNEVI